MRNNPYWGFEQKPRLHYNRTRVIRLPVEMKYSNNKI